MTMVVDGYEGLVEVFEGIQRDWDTMEFETTLEDLVPALEEDHNQYFVQGVAPTGEAWKELHPFTVAMKGHDTILVDSETLVDSLSDPDEDFAIRDYFREGKTVGLIFGTSVPYAWRHQEGVGEPGQNLPQRIHVGVTLDRVELFQQAIADHAVDQLRERTTGDA